MAHEMDNDPVQIGDKMYDVQFGAGEVVELKVADRFRVRFAKGTYTYEGTGIRVDASVRTLYWHNPIVVLPAKDDIRWDEARRLCSALIKELRSMR